ncbi:BrnT family toxin [Ketobacter sp. MCCC 1A13808]|uniref:BrnT family toxin n=1 Tax=Ketobacter sp. MCCC 1A13808 TaxID=2602738 RepID=UPI0012EBC05A|nr:BrnT family toxin [Ketobacter sp. MCCC 1A13808]MVF12252.1 BrnT family toxin [Ketobacter sp. MCCC 1A13808]
MYSFEFDPKKSESNQKKHGIDFIQAQAVWQDPDFIEIMAKSLDEPRALVVGMIGGKHWSAIITHREDKVRIISVRRSREAEVALYES